MTSRIARFPFLLTALLSLVTAASAQDGAPEGARSFPMLEVVDGDTIRVEIAGRSSSLRLLAIDTEETFQDARQRASAVQGFESYARARQQRSTKPVKYGTPFGEAARQFARDFFRGVSSVEVEQDAPDEKSGYYGRLLSYVFVVKDGRRTHYNVEVVRQGFSPYYVKYGRSRRYEADFKLAEKEAREAGRGMWGAWQERSCYPDYRARLAWWGQRAKVVDGWRARVLANSERPEAERELYISLNSEGAFSRLRDRDGSEVVVFGGIDRFRHPEGRVSRIVLSAPRELRLDVDLCGRVDDQGGAFRREPTIVMGRVKIRDGRVCLERGVVVEPALAVAPVPPSGSKPRAVPKGRAPGVPKVSSDRFDFSCVGRPAGEVVAELVESRGASVSYSGAMQGLKKLVTLDLKAVSLNEAVGCVMLAVGMRHKAVGENFVILPGRAAEREATLKRRVDELEREAVRLRKELAELRGDSVRKE